MEPSPLPKADKRTVSWWRSRLNQYRSLVVFSWNALTFHNRGYLPGLAVWAGIHLTVLVLFNTNYSSLQVTGQVLVISAILYILPYMASRLFQAEVFPQWNSEHETRFQHICVHLAHAQERTHQKIEMMLEIRRKAPWKFYCIGLALAMLLIYLGKLLSTMLVIHFLTCCVLLLPVVMEFNIMSTKNQQMAMAAALELYKKLRQKIQELADQQRKR